MCDLTKSFCGEIMFSVTIELQIMGRERMRGSRRPLFFTDDLCSGRMLRMVTSTNTRSNKISLGVIMSHILNFPSTYSLHKAPQSLLCYFLLKPTQVKRDVSNINSPVLWHLMVQPVDVLRGSGKRASDFRGKELCVFLVK